MRAAGNNIWTLEYSYVLIRVYLQKQVGAWFDLSMGYNLLNPVLKQKESPTGQWLSLPGVASLVLAVDPTPQRWPEAKPCSYSESISCDSSEQTCLRTSHLQMCACQTLVGIRITRRTLWKSEYLSCAPRDPVGSAGTPRMNLNSQPSWMILRSLSEARTLRNTDNVYNM